MKKKILILGLGNIGDKYVHTRHNVGFHIVEKIANIFKCIFSRNASLHAYLVLHKNEEDMVIIAKPTTYMNLSGQAARSLLSWYKIAPECCIVIVDTVDLPVGTLRCKKPSRKSSSTHNGIRSIVSHVGAGFYKLYVGVGERKENDNIGKSFRDMSSYVLQSWNKSEDELYEKMFNYSANVLKDVLHYPLDEIPNKLSKRLDNEIKIQE